MFRYRIPWLAGFLVMIIRDMKHSRLKSVQSVKHSDSQALIPKLVYSRRLPPNTLSHLFLYATSLSYYSHWPFEAVPCISDRHVEV